jgi:hypothetical protein
MVCSYSPGHTILLFPFMFLWRGGHGELVMGLPLTKGVCIEGTCTHRSPCAHCLSTRGVEAPWQHHQMAQGLTLVKRVCSGDTCTLGKLHAEGG